MCSTDTQPGRMPAQQAGRGPCKRLAHDVHACALAASAWSLLRWAGPRRQLPGRLQLASQGAVCQRLDGGHQVLGKLVVGVLVQPAGGGGAPPRGATGGRATGPKAAQLPLPHRPGAACCVVNGAGAIAAAPGLEGDSVQLSGPRRLPGLLHVHRVHHLLQQLHQASILCGHTAGRAVAVAGPDGGDPWRSMRKGTCATVHASACAFVPTPLAHSFQEEPTPYPSQDHILRTQWGVPAVLHGPSPSCTPCERAAGIAKGQSGPLTCQRGALRGGELLQLLLGHRQANHEVGGDQQRPVIDVQPGSALPCTGGGGGGPGALRCDAARSWRLRRCGQRRRKSTTRLTALRPTGTEARHAPPSAHTPQPSALAPTLRGLVHLHPVLLSHGQEALLGGAHPLAAHVVPVLVRHLRRGAGSTSSSRWAEGRLGGCFGP